MNDRKVSAGHRVLVADDHRVSREFTAAALRQAGCAVKQAASVQQACERALAWLPDLVILDWHLGDGTGLDAAHTLHERWTGDQPPVIVLLTADRAVLGDTGNVPAHQNSLFDRILEKPCSADQLADLLPARAWRVGEPLSENLPRIRPNCHGELLRKLPQIEQRLLDGRIRDASVLTHQLIASSGWSGEERLEEALRLLDRACRVDVRPEAVSDAWLRVTAAASEALANRP